MDFLKSIFGDKALTYAELETALKDNKEVKLANLAAGQYVDKEKFDKAETRANDLQIQLTTANSTIKGFKDLDVEGLKNGVADWEKKYKDDTAALNKKLADLQTENGISEAMSGKNFVNSYTRDSIKGKILEMVNAPENKGKSYSDLLTALTHDDKGQELPNIFSTESTQSQNPPPPGGGNPPPSDTSKLSDADYFAQAFKKN